MNLDEEGMDQDRPFVSVLDDPAIPIELKPNETAFDNRFRGKTAILSGRYEVLHPGHIKTILREAERFRRLYVYVVDNPNNAYPSSWTKELLDYATADLVNVAIYLDPRHFGRVTKEELTDLPPHDVFLSANPAVTAHLRALGENVEEIPRTEGYSGADIKKKAEKACNHVAVFINKAGFDQCKICGKVWRD